MADIVNPAKRSQMMSGIKSRNTKPEIILRRLLHRSGFRFRINVPKLIGKPDIVLKRYNAVVFVNGCFWHGHNCSLFKWPKTNKEFWVNKITRNQLNDKKVIKALKKDKWRVGIIWECAIRGNKKNHIKTGLNIASWLRSKKLFIEAKG